MEMIMLEHAHNKSETYKYWFINNKKAQEILDLHDLGKMRPSELLSMIFELRGCTDSIDIIKSIMIGSELKFGGIT
jgi:hypothetical protein